MHTQKKAEVGYTCERFHSKKKILRDEEVHYKMIEVSIHQEDRMILSVYAPNNKTSKYVHQSLTELKGKGRLKR